MHSVSFRLKTQETEARLVQVALSSMIWNFAVGIVLIFPEFSFKTHSFRGVFNPSRLKLIMFKSARRALRGLTFASNPQA